MAPYLNIWTLDDELLNTHVFPNAVFEIELHRTILRKKNIFELFPIVSSDNFDVSLQDVNVMDKNINISANNDLS